MNAGKQTGLFLAELGSWNLRQTAGGRYKVASISPTNGKANYAFGIKDGHIDFAAAMDAYKLRDERPELMRSIEAHFKGDEIIAEAKEEADPYGDQALNQRRKLSPEQNWRRGLLNMRRIEMEHAATKRESVWESGVRMLWAGVFKTKITGEDLGKTLTWITQRQGGVDLAELLRVERDYYDGKYVPQPSSTLEAQLDLLGGNLGFDNEEVENGNRRDEREVSSESGAVRIDDPDPFGAFR